MQYFVFHNSRLRLYLHLIAYLTSNKRLPYRRLVGNLAFQTVGLCRTYQFKLHLLVKSLVKDLNRTSDVNLIKVYLVLNYDFRILKDTFQLLNARLDVALLVFCRIILRILGQVSLLPYLLNLAGNLFTLSGSPVHPQVLSGLHK